MIDEYGIDELGRPNWDYYFISLAFVVAQRSLDESTKHGAIIVAEDNTILSVGYNSPPRGCDDEKVPQKRPEKYLWFLHAEEAAIINAAKSGTCLNNSIFYITGEPCAMCVRKIINVGAKKVIYGGINAKCVNEEDMVVTEQMLKGKNIEFIKIDNKNIFVNILKNTIKYIKEKS